MAGQAGRPGGHRAGPRDPGPDRHHRADHLERTSAGRTCTCTRCSAPFLDEGDILGHEPMGVVEEVGPEVTAVRAGDRVVIPFNMSCGTCFMCGQGLHSQCETTQVREQGMGGALFGYTKLYGQVPGGQAEYLRVPFGNTLPIMVPDGPPDERFVYLSDVLPTAWQAVEYAGDPDGGSVVVLGLGPIGDMCRPDRPAPRRRTGDRRRPRARAAGPRSAPRRRDARSARARGRPRRGDPRADRRPRARTRSSTPSAWRRTGHPVAQARPADGRAAARRGGGRS